MRSWRRKRRCRCSARRRPSPCPRRTTSSRSAGGARSWERPIEIVDKLGRLAESGIDEVVFIWFNLASNRVPEWLASKVLPQVAKL